MLITDIEKKEQVLGSTTQQRLAALGFKRAAARIPILIVKQHKMAIAYEHYRFVREEHITRFQDALKAKTYRGTPDNNSYQYLAFTPISDFQEIPPAHVLTNLEAATLRNCFDAFEIAHIREVKDPILFGRIEDCPDRFYIDQWDDDVKIEDILKENEG